MSEMTKAEATKRARALVKLLGKGWVSDVFQNIDWFYGAKLEDDIHNASANVIASPRFGVVDYTVYMSAGPLQVVVTGTDPAKVVGEAKKQMGMLIRSIQNSFNEMFLATN